MPDNCTGWVCGVVSKNDNGASFLLLQVGKGLLYEVEIGFVVEVWHFFNLGIRGF